MPILAAVDDFLFRSKIRATAKQLGIEIVFAATADEVIAKTKELNPGLLILDLNSAKTRPVETIAALKTDPATASVRMLGFVSHVDSATIAAARRAGADEVLARSQFAGNLPAILQAADAGGSRP
ncbi:MAG TPA: response regulator [Vicinamibacterales bacterium]|jgi:DNA-binding NarL/FixJ family response regulator